MTGCSVRVIRHLLANDPALCEPAAPAIAAIGDALLGNRELILQQVRRAMESIRNSR